MSRIATLAAAALFVTSLLIPFVTADKAAAPVHSAIEIFTVDTEATGYATFQSYNQRVVSNEHGIFLTYLKSRNKKFDANTWKLMRSQDGGKTFNVLCEGTHGANPPVLETDGKGNIYMAHPHWGIDYKKTDVLFYRLTPENGFKKPAPVVVPGGAAGKYAMLLDESRQQLYYFSHNNQFFVLDLNGKVKQSFSLTAAGKSAELQYPLLYLHGKDLYAAWTTLRHGKYLYWSIHFIRSHDGGGTWEKLDGTRLTLPVTVDETGPASEVTTAGEHGVHNWLSSFVVQAGKAHFAYMSQGKPAAQRYVRFDLAKGKEDSRILNWKGNRLEVRNLDGFFAVSRDGSRVFYTSRTPPAAPKPVLAVITSADGGTSWHDLAVQNPPSEKGITQIGGARAITKDDYLIGAYTELSSPPAVKFFRVKMTTGKK